MPAKDPNKLHPNWTPKRGGSGRRNNKLPRSPAMPSLTLDTSPTAQRGHSPSRSQSGTNSRSTSPGRPPPFSPITPTLSGARLASSSNENGNGGGSRGPPPPTRSYTHLQQTAQVGIPQPPMITVDFDTNPDVLALKSAIAVLLNQAKTATNDIATLERIKSRAMDDPEEFLKVLASGEIKTRSDPLFNPSTEQDHKDDDEDSADDLKRANGGTTKRKWDSLPAPQIIVRAPPINWAQYGIVGESLDKIHADQLARPIEGVPARVGADGLVAQGGEGMRRQANLGVAAPYAPGRDKIEKMSTRKGGKR